jgi:hypothetical protein
VQAAGNRNHSWQARAKAAFSCCFCFIQVSVFAWCGCGVELSKQATTQSSIHQSVSCGRRVGARTCHCHCPGQVHAPHAARLVSCLHGGRAGVAVSRRRADLMPSRSSPIGPDSGGTTRRAKKKAAAAVVVRLLRLPARMDGDRGRAHPKAVARRVSGLPLGLPPSLLPCCACCLSSTLTHA